MQIIAHCVTIKLNILWISLQMKIYRISEREQHKEINNMHDYNLKQPLTRRCRGTIKSERTSNNSLHHHLKWNYVSLFIRNHVHVFHRTTKKNNTNQPNIYIIICIYENNGKLCGKRTKNYSTECLLDLHVQMIILQAMFYKY